MKSSVFHGFCNENPGSVPVSQLEIHPVATRCFVLSNLGFFTLNAGIIPDFWKSLCSGKWDKAGSWE